MAKKQPTYQGKYGDIENHIKNIVIDSEFTTAKSNSQGQYADYESILDMVELVSSEKHYDWQSNIFIGLLLSHMLTDTATWAGQDFASRDFTDIYLSGAHPDDLAKAAAAKTLINTILNIKDVYHFQKRMRARTINWLFGQVYTLMWWEQKVVTRQIPQPPISQIVDDWDEQGNYSPRMIRQEQPPVSYEDIIYDRMNYEVFDSRNVFTDFTYNYSAQQKSWITLRSQKNYSQVKADAEKRGYFNLDILEEKLFELEGKKKRKVKIAPETQTSRESVNKLGGAYGTKMDFFKKVDPELDILDRYGSMWAIVTERDEDDVPTAIEPGYSDDGSLKDKAELVESIVTYAGVGDDWTLIGFAPTWAVDAKGQPFKPIIRAWCYIHPTKDIGISDGKNLREMNIAANDTFNISNDRVMLATLPVLKGRRDAIENNPTVFIEPENLILLENVDQDLKEMVIRDNITGALNQMAFIKATSSEMDSIWPTTMGGLPEKTSTTATAVAGAESRTGARGNLKSLTWTYTNDVEFYQMLLHMAYRFMHPKTLNKILGEDAKDFDPNADYTYVPITENIESEHNKMRKVGVYDQMNGRLAGLAKIFPKEIAKIIAYNTGKQAELMGSEFVEIKDMIEGLMNAKPAEEGQGATQEKDAAAPPTSNQFGNPMQVNELASRGMI